VDGLSPEEWTETLLAFRDANLYQTRSYGSIRWGSENISQLAVYKDEIPVSLSQQRIAKLPVLGKGIAYLRWGPVWVSKEGPPDAETVTWTLRALKEEYSNRRGLLLRMLPTNRGLEPALLRQIGGEEGFEIKPANYQTLLVDLRPSLEEIRKNFDPKWRTQLNQSERNDLEYRIGAGPEFFEDLIATYDEMVDLKRFQDSVDVHEHQRIQEDLPESCKMRVAIGTCEGQPVTSLLFWAAGDRGLALIGGSNETGRRTKAGYGLHWRVIQYLKEVGCEYYDLGGVSRERNPGGYLFKKGLAGKNSEAVSYPGQFEYCRSALFSRLVDGVDKAAAQIRTLRARIGKRNGVGIREKRRDPNADFRAGE
jgi:hypothetical protein